MLNKIKGIKALLKNEEGAETLEYIVIAAVIILAGAAAYKAIGIGGLISSIFVKLSNVVS